MPDDILVMNVTVKTNVSVGHIQGVTINPIRSIVPDVESILNITLHREKGEDYDYDYGEQALPPSLPNVRIIPFVAADALVKAKDVPSSEAGYSPGSAVASSELRPTDAASGFYDIATQENRFSPPVKTEGGFVPREPPYFDVPYRSTDLSLEIGTGVTVVPAQVTNPHQKNDDLSSKCHFENMEYRHGEILPSIALCVICMCYYGEIVCSSECPPLKIGCQRVSSEERCCGKIVCVEADESPTVVLDRVDATAPSQRQPTVSPDPFRDVIKTEPAPDLPSLIEDMLPYLVEHGITTSRPTSMVTVTLKNLKSPAVGQQQHPSDFMQVPLMPPSFDYREETADISFIPKTKYDTANTATSTKNNADILTRDSEDQLRDKIFDYDETTSTSELPSRTIDNSTNNLRWCNITEQKLAQENTTQTEDEVDHFLGKVDNRVVEQHNNHTDGSTTERDSEDDAIFSLDSVLELLFSSNNSSDRETTETTKSPDVSSVIADAQEGQEASATSSATKGLTEGTEIVETSSKVLENEIPMAMGSLLKVAGCNIYGRMYRVGRIITELSSSCKECRCTEIGVQCKPLECRSDTRFSRAPSSSPDLTSP